MARSYCRTFVFAGSSSNTPERLYSQVRRPAFIEGLAGEIDVKFSHEPVYHLGPAGTGSPPHSHPDVFNGAFFGSRLWAIFPPSYVLFSGETTVDWWLGGSLTRELETLPAAHQPALFLQRPGDTVFIPGGLAHATINVEDAMGLVSELWQVDPGTDRMVSQPYNNNDDDGNPL